MRKQLILFITTFLTFGGILAWAYARLATSLRSLSSFGNYKAPLNSFDYKFMTFIVLACAILGVLIFAKRRYIDKEEDFNLFNKLKVSDISADKNRAIYHPVPKQFLSKNPDGLTVGKYMGKYVRIPFKSNPEHILVIGSPGSNKSSSILSSLLWHFHHKTPSEGLNSVLAVDVKPELSAKSVDESRSDVRIIKPSKFDGWGFDVFFGLTPSSNEDEIKERCETIANALIPSLSGDNIHFSSNARKILSAFLMHGFIKGLSFTDSIIKVMTVSVQDYIAEILADPDMANHTKITGKIKGYQNNDSDEFSSIVDTLQMNLAVFDIETVKYCFSENPRKVIPQNLLDGISVFVSIEDHLLQQYKTVFGLIMELSLKYLMSIPEHMLQNKRPVHAIIDEGGSVYVPSISNVLAVGRSKKIQVSLIVQSFSQLKKLYGDNDAITILNCCKTTICFACNDTQTARDLSAWTGDYRETKVSTHSSAPGMFSVPDSHNTSTEYRRAMDVADIKSLEKDFKVLVFSKGSWFVCSKAPYYTIPELRDLSDRLYRKNTGQIEDEPKFVQTYADYMRRK